MFCKNSFQQLTLTDSINNMPKYLWNILEKSWAQPFQEYIFPNINEELFAVLYSENHASRPNSPVNVIIGLLILKELFQLSDEELIGSLYFDTRFQYALRTTSYEKQPVSINTLGNFRARLYEYEKITGIDLIQQEVEEQAELIAQYIRLDNNKVRMDSFMVSSSSKKLSRIELVYSVNAQFVKLLNKLAANLIPEECKAYLGKGHKNETIYKTHDTESESKLEFLLKQAIALYDAGSKGGENITSTEEFQLLSRMLKEQLADGNFEEPSPKPSKEISPESLQNPTDPDATYRKKYGDNVGYVANVAETFADNKSLITYYDLKPNTYSDSKFADDVIEKLIKERNETSDKTQLIVDGAYYEQERAEKASTKGIDLIPGELVGRKPSSDKITYDQFIIDAENKKVLKCPDGQEPTESYYSSKSYTGKFNKEKCNNCSCFENCPIKKQKKFNVIRFSEKRYKTDVQRKKMGAEEYIQITNQRAGVEGIPSVFRRRYSIDNMPIRGFVRSKIWFGFKVAAFNIKKLIKQVLSSKGILSATLLSSLFYIICNDFTSFFTNKKIKAEYVVLL